MTGRAAEGRHDPGTGEWWEECWEFEFATRDATFGGFVRVALYPNQRRAWCWVYVLSTDGTVVVRDHDVPLPPPAILLARSEALWCELVCEVPMVHWSIGVEAFGVQLDDPYDGLRGEIGIRMPVGLDLDWEASGDATAAADRAEGYEQNGDVHGDVLLADGVIALDGVGIRRHTWGDRDWSQPWQQERCAAGIPVRSTPELLAVVPLLGVGAESDGNPHVTRALSRCVLPDGSEAPGWLEALHTGE
ncbi:MAG TPA: hypothetical protein VGI86_09970 [Acidimicrobiia bacterium]